ncbi:hypothetical protein [Methylovulum psychrotolerans]|uniref:hypothetical protein n=1 Tax=Methylovulum psychrotolerans TaxID=1704499 RepID=UPI0012F92663|nr:hypothetical protein [Methylovulum psychrotolerans]
MAYPAAFRKKLLSVMKEQGLTIPEAASCPHRSDPGSAQLPAFFNHVNNLKNSFIIVHIATKTLNLMAVTPSLPIRGGSCPP